MKKKLFCFLTIICLIMPCVVTLAGCFGSSNGSEYYISISSATQFINKVKDSQSITNQNTYQRRSKQYTYTLTKDLDFKDINYTPINTFYDVLDGNGHTIKNLTIISTEDNIGLFRNLTVHYSESTTDGWTLNGTVSNIKFENLTITGNNYVGGIAGKIETINSEYAKPSLQNIEIISGVITGNDYVGGMIGASEKNDVMLSNCSNLVNRASVSGDQHVGGIFGFYSQGDEPTYLNNAKNYGNISSTASFYPTTDENKLGNVGGIFGTITVDNKIMNLKNLQNFGNISCEYGYYVGGVVGNIYYKNIDDLNITLNTGIKLDTCINYGNIYGRSSVGGVVGQVGGKHTEIDSPVESYQFATVKFTDCKNHGKVSCNDQRSYAVYDEAYKDDGFYIGGIIGRDFSTEATFERCKNTVLTQTEIQTLGIVYNPSEICIKGVGYVGGISGAYGLSFTSCSNNMDIYIGTISSTETEFSYAGGICGFSYNNMPDGTKFNALKTRTFNNCTNSGNIYNISKGLPDESYHFSSIGGIAGVGGHVDVDNCSNTGNIYGTKFIGGIFGELDVSNNSNLDNISNTGTIYAGQSAYALGSIVGYGRGTTGTVNITKVTIGGSIQTKANANNIGGIYGYWGDINRYIYGSNIYDTTALLQNKLSLSNVTYEFSVGKQPSATYININSICGACSNPEDPLAKNNNYTLTVTNSTYPND